MISILRKLPGIPALLFPLLQTKGFSKNQVLRLFLNETVLLSIIASFLGIAVGVAILPLANLETSVFGGFRLLDVFTIAFAVVFGVLLAIFSVFSPARSAANMKNVFFKKIAIQNFLSVGEEPVCINFNTGINLITGSNKDKPDRQNAVGKSTVADALYFAIFGETLRELKRDLIINNVTGGTAQVVLEFDVEISGNVNSYKACTDA
jgi:cbb3-type cytochrome oxidase subunit 1